MLFVFVAWRPEAWVMALGFSSVFVALLALAAAAAQGRLRRRCNGPSGCTASARTPRWGLRRAGRRRVTAGPAVRDAATVILVRRDGPACPRVLMGQRGAAAAFMPDKFVFPGGAVDAGDLALAGAARRCDAGRGAARRRAIRRTVARALPLAAVRELWEETGLRARPPGPGGGRARGGGAGGLARGSSPPGSRRDSARCASSFAP